MGLRLRKGKRLLLEYGSVLKIVVGHGSFEYYKQRHKVKSSNCVYEAPRKSITICLHEARRQTALSVRQNV
jgi:hypothetical protein